MKSIVCPQQIDTGARTGQRSGMRWDEQLLGLFDDLEQQAEGLALAERDALVAEQSRAEYAGVDLAARLHGSTGARVQVDVTGLGSLDGTVLRTGDGWCLLAVGGREWIVVIAAATALRGLAEGGVGERARPLTGRLGLGSALRGVAESGGEVVLHLRDGAVTRGVLGRVGADFVEVRPGSDPGQAAGAAAVLPFAAIAALSHGLGDGWGDA